MRYAQWIGRRADRLERIVESREIALPWPLVNFWP
jgi:hypothetical protein